jgi:chromosome segregation ATPase
VRSPEGDLQAEYDDLNAKDGTLDQDIETCSREVLGLRQHSDDANGQIRRLTTKLQDACSSGKELGRIEGLFWSWKSRWFCGWTGDILESPIRIAG